MHDPLLLPLLVSLLAGLATALGGGLALVMQSSHRVTLGAGLGLSGGAMVYISFVELFPSGAAMLGEVGIGPHAIASFFAGVGVIALIDWLVPSAENPHEAVLIEDQRSIERDEMHRTGRFTALVIAFHNFPEGVASFYSTVDDRVGVAVALHNIPEGIAVALPIYYATGNRQKAFLFSLLSGLAEPVGAILGVGVWAAHRNV